MAKKNQVFIDIVIDDQGTTKRVAVNAKKLGVALDDAGVATDRAAKGTDKLGKSSKDLDRNMRGTAKMTSNGTKEFSKMSQGMGGLVGAYATLAAQVFAVSAAFQFLSRASEITNLIEGQRAMGNVTGVAYKTITDRIVEATDAQIKFGDAGRAAAIGTAAGLQAGQLEALGTAAKNASFALGRDLTDSFNRLIRGVTKAEPELLDELGIILRLETATEKYAQSIGKSRTELNEYERTQAVTNEVLEQAQRKFAAIQAQMDPNAAALSQFAKSFDDLVRGFQTMLISGLRPVLQFLSENTTALTAALTLFAIPIVRAILPSLDDWEQSTKKLAKRNTGFFKAYRQGLKNSAQETLSFIKTQEALEKSATKSARKILKDSDKSAGLDFLRGEGKATDKRKQAAAKKIIDNALQQTKGGKDAETGYLAGKNREQVLNLQKSYDSRVNLARAANKKTILSFAFLGKSTKTIFLGIGTAWKGTMAGMAIAARGAAVAINTAMSATAILGVIFLLYEAGKALKEFFFPLSAEAKRQKKIISELGSSYEDLRDQMIGAREARETMIAGFNRQINEGNIIASADVSGIIEDINKLTRLDKTSKDYQRLKKEVQGVVLELARIDPRFAVLRTALKEQGVVGADAAKQVKRVAGEYINLGQQLANVPNLIKDANSAISDIGKGFNNTALSNVVDKLELAIEGVNLRISESIKTTNDFAIELADALEIQEKIDARRAQLAAAPGAQARGRSGNAVRQSQKQDVELNKLLNDVRRRSVQDQKDMNQQMKDGNKLREEDNLLLDEFTKKFTFANQQEQKILKSRARIISQQAEDAYTRVLGNDVYAQLLNIDEERNKINQKIAAAQEKVIVAETNLRFTTGEKRKTALEALEVAKQGLVLADAERTFQNEVLSAKERQLKIERELISLTFRRIQLENAQRESARKLAFVDAIGGGTEESIRERAKLQRKQLEDAVSAAKIEVQAAEKARVEEQSTIRNNVLKEMGGVGDYIFGQGFERADEFEQRAGEAVAAAPGGRRVTAAEQSLRDAENALEIDKNKLTLFKNQNEALVEQARQQMETVGFTQAHVLFNERILEAKRQNIVLTDTELQLLKQQSIETTMLATIAQEKQSLFFSIGDSISGAFTSIIDGSMSAKDAFKQMAKSILADILSMVVRLTVMRALMSFLPFPGGGSIDPSLGGTDIALHTGTRVVSRMGGVFEPKGYRMGGKVKDYSTGGIARGSDHGYPAVLHGREAVVPLPSGDKIPVELNGAGGQQNNVTVNVSVNNDGTATTNTEGNSGGMENLGRLVAKAVQDELVEQKRAGGILSPYGAM